MIDYLQHLEKLGALRASGVLTDDEFESEKARILSAKDDIRSHGFKPAVWSRQQRITVAAVIGVLILCAAAIGYGAIERNGDIEEKKGNNVAGEKAEAPTTPAEINFLSMRDCTPNEAMAMITRQLQDALVADYLDRPLVDINNESRAEVRVSFLKASKVPVKLAEIPLNAKIAGLDLQAIALLDWPNGSGIRLTFKQPVELVRSKFASAENSAVLSSIPGSPRAPETLAFGSNSGTGLVTCLSSKREGETERGSDKDA